MKTLYTPFYLKGIRQNILETIPREPGSTKPVNIAALTCHKTYTGNLKWNENGLWFPHKDIVDAVKAQEPDLLYFSGDQIYEGDLTPAQQKSENAYILDYLYKWMHWCWAFQEVTRNTPCIPIPDDHDVYHGNLWGAGETQCSTCRRSKQPRLWRIQNGTTIRPTQSTERKLAICPTQLTLHSMLKEIPFTLQD